MENTGSIIIFICIILIQTLFILQMKLMGHRINCQCSCKSKCCPKACNRMFGFLRNNARRIYKDLVSVQVYVNGVIRFFLETFIELFICSAVSWGFAKEVQKKERSTFDKISVLITYILLTMVLIFPLIAIWYSCTKGRELTKRSKDERNYRYKQVWQDVRKSVHKLNSMVQESPLVSDYLENPFSSTS